MEDTAAPRFLSTTAASRGPTSTKDGSQSCRRLLDPANARWSSKRWVERAGERGGGGHSRAGLIKELHTFHRDGRREEVSDGGRDRDVLLTTCRFSAVPSF